jgi:hypothetical protein
VQAYAAHPVAGHHSLVVVCHRSRPFLGLALAEALVEVAVAVVVRSRRYVAGAEGSFQADLGVDRD